MRFDDSSVDISGSATAEPSPAGRWRSAVAASASSGFSSTWSSALAGGGDVTGLAVPWGTQVQGSGERAGDLEQRCNSEGALDRYNDCFLMKVYNEINEVWTGELGPDYEAHAGVLHPGHAHGMRPRLERRRSLLLPRRPQRLYRHRFRPRSVGVGQRDAVSALRIVAFGSARRGASFS